jgi:hypothetical protein
MADDDTKIVVRGRLRIVEYAVRADGIMPAKGFFDALYERDRAWLLARFQLLANQGEQGISNESIFRREREIPQDIQGTRGWLWTFKRRTNKRPGGGKGLIRIPCFMIENRWILLTGFWKPPKDKWPEANYTESFTIIREVMRRERNT